MVAKQLIRKTLGLGTIAAVGGIVGIAMAEPAAAQSALATVKKLDGAWRGGGTVNPTKGGRERISCRVSLVRGFVKLA